MNFLNGIFEALNFGISVDDKVHENLVSAIKIISAHLKHSIKFMSGTIILN